MYVLSNGASRRLSLARQFTSAACSFASENPSANSRANEHTGDEQRPKCRRCEKKKLDCNRPSKVTVFRHDAMSTFATDQKWVKSQARKCKLCLLSSPAVNA